MENIEKISVINKEKLNGEFYLQSLLEEAFSLHLITDADIERIQYECLELLANRTERYNSGDSSSIHVEAAQSIMTSNLYTIGIWLKTYSSADAAVNALQETKIAELYANGRKRIDIMLKTAKTLHSKVLNSMIETDNVFYNETVVGGIKGFFKIYNPDFEAHEIHITADYPLCNPIQSLVGIEFIQKYLESMLHENGFCQNFSSDDIHHLLCGHDKTYQALLLNIYEPVLTAAIGCIIAGEDVRRLNVTKTTVSHLNSILRNKSKNEVDIIILSAFDELKDIFTMTGLQEQYIKTSLRTIASKISSAIELQTLDKLFLIASYPENDPKLYFSFGDKMDNDLYRKIVEEIMQCRHLSDKIAIIKEQIHSLADLEDILLDAELPVHEVSGILHKLDLPEIAALSKKYPFKSDLEAIDRKEQERILSKCLYDFIASLPEEQQAWLSKAVDMLDISF